MGLGAGPPRSLGWADGPIDISIAGDERGDAASETTHAPRRSLQQGERTVGGSAPHRHPSAPIHQYGSRQAHGPGAGRLQASAALSALRSRSRHLAGPIATASCCPTAPPRYCTRCCICPAGSRHVSRFRVYRQANPSWHLASKTFEAVVRSVATKSEGSQFFCATMPERRLQGIASAIPDKRGRSMHFLHPGRRRVM
jgi:hypothetical protein